MADLLSRRDVDFLLFDWLQVEEIASRSQFSEHTRDTLEAALDSYERVAQSEFAPHNKINDRREPVFDGVGVSVNPEIAHALRVFAEAGLMAAGQAGDLGGMQLPSVVERAGMAFIVGANAGSAAYAFLTIANANLLLAHGTEPQIKRYVRPMLSGTWLGTMCLSESQAGSSLGDIATRAERQQDERYRLFGNKMWISGGDHDLTENIVHLVLAKVPDHRNSLVPGAAGISLFIVPKYLPDGNGRPGERNDVVTAGLNHKMGYRGTSNCLLNLGEGAFYPEGRPGAIGELVGQEGQGLAQMFHMMNEARIGVGLAAAAIGYAGYLRALEYARERRQGRPPNARDPSRPPIRLIDHADVRRMLLAQKAYVEGGLALVLYSAKLADEARSSATREQAKNAQILLDVLTPVAKSWPSQWCLAANDLAIQVHGGYGYTRDYVVEQLYRDNRLNMIHEGTAGIQALDLLGRKVPANDCAGLRALGTRVAAAVNAAQAYPEIAPPAGALRRAWRQFVAVTESLLSIEDRECRLANATAYMDSLGHIVVASLWLEQASVAARFLGGRRSDFCRGKIAACRYFLNWELPRVRAWLGVLDPIERTPLDMEDVMF